MRAGVRRGVGRAFRVEWGHVGLRVCRGGCRERKACRGECVCVTAGGEGGRGLRGGRFS